MDAFYTDFNIITTASFLTFSCKSQPAFSIYTSPHHRSLVTQHHMIPWYNSAGHLIRIRNRKAVPGWISYSRMSAFYTKFSITPELIIQRNNSRISSIFLQIPSLPFSLLVFLLYTLVGYTIGVLYTYCCIFTRACGSSSRFCGLMSRWQIPRA